MRIHEEIYNSNIDSRYNLRTMVIYALILMILCQIFEILRVKHPFLEGEYVPIPQICSVVMHNQPSSFKLQGYALCNMHISAKFPASRIGTLHIPMHYENYAVLPYAI